MPGTSLAQRYLSPRGVGLDLYFYLSERIANFLIGYSITDGPLELLSCRLFLILALLTAFPGSSKHDVRFDHRRKKKPAGRRRSSSVFLYSFQIDYLEQHHYRTKQTNQYSSHMVHSSFLLVEWGKEREAVKVRHHIRHVVYLYKVYAHPLLAVLIYLWIPFFRAASRLIMNDPYQSNLVNLISILNQMSLIDGKRYIILKLYSCHLT